MRKGLVIVAVIWTVLLGCSLYLNYQGTQDAVRGIVLETARTLFVNVELVRDWNALHGGVYVPVTEKTQPNPYLKGSMRDIQVHDELQLTKMNPAYMTRQLAELAAARKTAQFHITSLKPIRPENKPSPWERKALESFEQGVPEVGEYTKNADGTVFRYMAPLRTKESCLACHAEQGYKKGDIRGGISVTLLEVPQPPVLSIWLWHSGCWFGGLVLILVVWRKLDLAYQELHRQSSLDALTGVPNRWYFAQKMVEEYQRGRREKSPLSIIMADIDHFKNYNDTYGHKAGDECLKQVAQAILRSMKRPADFCARYGGEEFVAILPNTPKAGALDVAERIRTSVEDLKIHHSDSPVNDYVTISLGVNTGIPDDSHFETMLRKSDKALYQAKANGRNRVEEAGKGGNA